MKNLLFLSIIALFSTLSSCSIYENVAFKENGNVGYNMTFDASQMLKMEGSLGGLPFPIDSVISFESMMNKSHVAITDEQREILKPLNFEVQLNRAQQELKFVLRGDFENAEALNAVFKCINSLNTSDNKDMKTIAALLERRVEYSWDGRTMTMNSRSPKKMDVQADNNEETLVLLSCMLKTTYQFPSQIETVNDTTALFSLNKKSVTFVSSAGKRLERDQKLIVEVK